MRLASYPRLAVLCAFLALSATGCGSHTSADAPAAVVRVREKDFRLVVHPARVPAGRLRLTVRNSGPSDHELVLVRARRGALPLRTDGLTVSETALERATVATLEPAGPHTVRSLDLTLTPGRYELFCNMAGHYMGGMRTFLVVS
jgi:uncharacterized cupredoxin-like copper-binding protein